MNAFDFISFAFIGLGGQGSGHLYDVNAFDFITFAVRLAATVFVWALLWVAPLSAFLFAAYVCWSIPLRRKERARLTLDLIENGLRDGRAPEDTLKSLYECRDRSLGARFHILAARVAGGMRFGEALERVPRLLPPQAAHMLKAGERIGDLRKVMPACRQLLRDAESQTTGAMNYLMLFLAYFMTPVGVAVFAAMEIYVLPQLLSIAGEMGMGLPAELVFLRRHRAGIIAFQLGMMAPAWVMAVMYVGGPRVTQSLRSVLGPLVSWAQYAVPWRHKRMQRDFSAMLAILLDSGVPEDEALTLAAQCTANSIFEQRAARTAAKLRDGTKLSDAVLSMDDSGEFRWRLTNACHMHGGFFRAILGWNRWLDAKAFQQEQAAAQIITTILVAMNGVVVGLVAVTVFRVLISVVEINL